MNEDLEGMLTGLTKLLREREAALEDREREVKRLEAKLESEHPNFGSQSDVLRLNIGGKRIDVLRRTLTQVEGSMLESKFSGRWDESIEKDADGNFFIDQPEHLFVPLINFLRSKQSETPLAKLTRSPTFLEDPIARESFQRMVEYYGLTPGVYPMGMSIFNGNGSWKEVGAGECEIESEEWATFCMRPLLDCHTRNVNSYEVTLGQCSNAQIGWIDDLHRIPLTEHASLSRGGRGVGYGSIGMALDCTNAGIAVRGDFKELLSSGLVDLKEGSVIRSENQGRKWFVNGTLVASSTAEDENSEELNLTFPIAKFGNVWVPCLSIRGKCKISAIELEF